MALQNFVFTPHPEDSQTKTYSYCIDYMNLGNRWTATFSNGTFYHYRNGDKKQMHTDDHLDYDTKKNGLWRLEIKDGRMIVGPVNGKMAAGKMEYIGWDGAVWTAEPIRLIDFHPDLK